MRLIASGKTLTGIAAEMSLSVKTVSCEQSELQHMLTLGKQRSVNYHHAFDANCPRVLECANHDHP